MTRLFAAVRAALYLVKGADAHNATCRVQLFMQAGAFSLVVSALYSSPH
jgi:hypothetical protein